MILEVTLDPGATMPTRAHKTDAGLDLYSERDWWLRIDRKILKRA